MAEQAKTRPPDLRYVLALLCFCWFIRLDQIVFGQIEFSTLGIDSDQFLSMAGALLDLPVPLVGGVARYDSGFDIRTPAYPVLLTIPLQLTRLGVPLSNALAILHASILLLTLFCLIQLLKRWLPPGQIALATLLGAIPMRHHFFMLLAEWQAFCLLLIFLALAARLYHDRDGSAAMLTALLASATTLTRPDFIVLAPVTAAIVLLRTRRTLTVWGRVLLGFLPLLLLISINLYRFQRITLAPAEGHGFALLSPFSSQSEIEELVAQCLMPGVTIPHMQTGLSPAVADMLLLNPIAQLDAGSTNLNSLADAFHESGYINWSETNSCLMQVSAALLRLHSGPYLENYLFSLSTLLWMAPFVLLIPVWMRSRKTAECGLFLLFSIAIAVHSVHVAFVSAVNIMHLRYYVVTFTPLLTATALIYCSFARKRRSV